MNPAADLRRVAVLLRGYVDVPAAGRQRSGCTVTLIHGDPLVLVDTGDPTQQRALLAALAREQVTPAEIAWVINTHGHLDHIGNNALFPDATFVLDNDLARLGEYWTHDFDASPLEITGGHGGRPIVVLRTPGHTDHDLSVIVDTAEGRIAIAGDLFEYEGDRDDGAWKAWSRNLARQQASRGQLLALADQIVPGHGDMFRVVTGTD